MLGSARSTACRRLLQVAFAAALLALAAGAGGASAKPGSANGGPIADLTWGVPQTIRSLDYTHSGDPGTASVVFLGMEPLVRYDAQGRLQPALASSFSIPNPTTYVYNLRKGVKFWDGTPLTAADVIYSLQRSASKEGGSQLATFFGSVASMKATGPSQVTIKLKGPNPFFRYSLAVTTSARRRSGAAPEGHRDAGRDDVHGPVQVRLVHAPTRASSSTQRRLLGQEAGGQEPDPQVHHRREHAAARDAFGPGRRHVQGPAGPDRPVEVALRRPRLARARRSSRPTCRSTSRIRPSTTSTCGARSPTRSTRPGLVKAVLRGYGQPAPTMPPPQQWGDLMSQAKVQAFYASLPAVPVQPREGEGRARRSRLTRTGSRRRLPFPTPSPSSARPRSCSRRT